MISNRHIYYAMKEREIDIKDLFWEIAYAWRLILISIIVMALLCGGYGFWKIVRQKQMQEAQELVPIDTVKGNLTEEELDDIERLMFYDALLQDQETYYENSILMNVNPYEKQSIVLEYCIDTQYEINFQEPIKADITSKLITAYREYFNQNAYMEDVNDSLSQQIEERYVSEVVHFYAYDSGVFTLTIIGIDEQQANEIADAVSTAVESCKTQQEQLIGPHKLIMLDRYETCTVDEDLMEKQLECIQDIEEIKKQQATLLSSLTPQQILVYNGTLEHSETIGTTAMETYESIIKYVFLGMALGFLASCLWISCKFIYGRCIHSAKEIREIYAVRCLGSIGYERKQKKLLPFVDRWFDVWRRNHNFSMEEQVEQCKVRVKMLCKQEAIDKLVVITSLSLHEKERASLFELLKQLEDSGISSRLYENVLENMESMEEISDMDHVLILERIGNTQYKTLEEEISVCMYYNIHLLGVLMLGKEV